MKRSRAAPGPGLAPILVAAFLLAAGSGFPSRAGEEATKQPAGDAQESRGPVRRFFHDHGWHILAAVGIDQAAQIYDRSVGFSTDPLIFEDPPGIDRWVRDRLKGSEELKGYVETYGLETLRYGVPIGLVFLDLGNRHQMLPDLMGYVETFYTNRGLTDIFKNIFGRERPPLEFAAEEGATPEEIAALEEDKGNHQSFPSGHASGSFAFASYLERAIAREIGLESRARIFSFAGLYGLAGYISYSRIHRDKHYLTDILAGGAMGVAISRTLYRLNHPGEFGRASRASSRAEGWRVSLKPPVIVPGGAALMVGITPGGTAP